VGDGGKGLVVILYPGRVNLRYYQNTLEIPLSRSWSVGMS